MSERIQSILKLVRGNQITFSTLKARLFTESYRANEGMPEVVRTATAQAYMMERFPLFLLDGDLIAGNQASKVMGVECDFWSKGVWTDEGIESLRAEKTWGISDEDADVMKELSAYWKNIIADYKTIDLYDEELWRWRRIGFLLPPCKNADQAAGSGFACNGFNLVGDYEVNQIDYGYVMQRGIRTFREDAARELERMMRESHGSAEEIEKIYFLRAAIISFDALIGYARRFSAFLAAEAEKCPDAVRKAELEKMAAICARVPEDPPRTFHEALQFQWFIFLMLVTRNTTPIGRFDQYMYPYYKADIEAGRIDDTEVLELLQCYRLKFMQFRTTSGGGHRKKWSGNARWNNMVIGGLKPDGTDGTNELSYLAIEAAFRCPTPHHTLTVRVHEHTPDRLMLEALKLVRTGIGMPAFVGDQSYIANMLSKGVPIEKARDYYIMGCIDPTVPEGFGFIFPSIVMTMTLDTFLHNGENPRQGLSFGVKTGDVRGFATFDELFDKYMEHVAYYMHLYAKDNNIRYETGKNVLQEAFPAALFSDGIEVGKIGKKRALPYGLGPTINVSVGTINVANSLYAIKKLVFEDKTITMDQLIAAMDANWAGEEGQRIRTLCMDAPKYGNDIDEVDELTYELYKRLDDLCEHMPTYRGGTYNTAGVSITAHEPGGEIIGATPDGRVSGQTLADGSVSAAQGTDTNGPTALIKSAIHVDQTKFQSLLFNMKLHPSSVRTDEDLMKLAALIKVYFRGNGKHIQFNVVDQETLRKAKLNPQEYQDLIVRVAGYSAYFVQLSPGMQDELIARTNYEHLN